MGQWSGCDMGLQCDLSHSPDLGWSLLKHVLTEQRTLKKNRVGTDMLGLFRTYLHAAVCTIMLLISDSISNDNTPSQAQHGTQ